MLRDWGVRRLSVGSALASAAFAVVPNVTRELLDAGTYQAMFADPVSGAEVNALCARAPVGS